MRRRVWRAGRTTRLPVVRPPPPGKRIVAETGADDCGMRPTPGVHRMCLDWSRFRVVIPTWP